MITQAISSPRSAKTFSRAGRSLNGTVIVVAATALGTPGLSGTPEGSSAAACFYKQAVMVTMVAADEFNDAVTAGVGAC